jgi:uncharacterized protein (DUF1778 family)
MTGATKRKEHPLSMRLPEADIAVIDRAASLRGRSRTDFVREAAVRAAEDVLLENTLVRMSNRGFAAFMAAVTAPARPVPEMVEMFRRRAPWETDDAKN